MGRFSNSTLKPVKKNHIDQLIINKSKGFINMDVKYFMIKDGDYFVSLLPTIGISGYGETEKGAFEMMQEALDMFFNELFDVDRIDALKELKIHGWVEDRYRKKRLKAPAYDRAKVIKEYNLTEESIINEAALQTA